MSPVSSSTTSRPHGLTFQGRGPTIVEAVDAQSPRQCGRHLLMAELVAVEAIREPQAWILRDRILLEVHHHDTVSLGLGANDVVQLGDPLSKGLAERIDRRKIGHGEAEHHRAMAARLGRR